MFRSEDELLLEGYRGFFFMFFREISKQCPKFDLKRFLTNPFPFYYALFTLYCIYLPLVKGKGKTIPLQAWTGPEGSRRLRLPDFKTIGT